MEHIYVDKEFTFASNAHILVRHKTAELFSEEFIASLPDEAILIPRKAIYLTCQKLTKDVSLSDDKKMFQIHRTDESIISFKLPTDLRYPNANNVIPKIGESTTIKKIGIRSSFLSILTEAMGCDIVKLLFFGEHKAIYVTESRNSVYSELEYPSAIGVIMPVMLNE
jgi:hypothetical protein